MNSNIALKWSMIAACFAIAYYFFVYLPNIHTDEKVTKDAERMSAEFSAALQKDSLANCLDSARASYVSNWENACKAGYANCMKIRYANPEEVCSSWKPNSTWNCLLSDSAAATVNTYQEQDREQCYRQYPQ